MTTGSGTLRVTVADLHAFCVQALTRVGVSAADACTTADVLVMTDTWGVFTHGVKSLHGYVRRPGTGRLRFIEVQGRVAAAKTVTVTRNEVLTGLNKPEDDMPAIVEVDGDTARPPRCIRRPFRREPDFGVTSVNYDLGDLLERAEEPA